MESVTEMRSRLRDLNCQIDRVMNVQGGSAVDLRQEALYLRNQIEETQLHEHMRAEGRNSWNDNPDGCYYCGSSHHHSSDCQERE